MVCLDPRTREGLFCYLVVKNIMQKQVVIDFEKMNGLIPAVIQDLQSKEVLMVGFMNKEAWEKTVETKRVTFWSRTREMLWIKGETSGNYLEVQKILLDCDSDTLLIMAKPTGPVCHLGTQTCFEKEIIND